jgi:hypothetical protein
MVMIYLSYAEYHELGLQAEETYRGLEQSIIDIIHLLIAEGANPHASVVRVK